ncbi:MAG: peptidoglycan-binding domain-containing protein [Hyphomicrobium sp.]
MRSFIGLSCLVVGLAVAAAFYAPAVHGPVMSGLSVAPPRTIETERTFAPTSGDFVSAVRDFEAPIASAISVPAISVPATPPAAAPLNSWQPAVTSPRVASRAIPRLTTMQPGDESATADLVRQLQSGLTIAGCYHGPIDGSWGAETKRSMQDFLARVNAQLPMSEPDYILLQLVRSRQGGVCGTTSPAAPVLVAAPTPATAPPAVGQAMAETNGPDAGSVGAADPGTTEAAALPEPLPGRMSAGGPIGEPAVVKAPRRAPSRTPHTRAVRDIFTNPLGGT